MCVGTVFNIQKFCVNDGPGIRTTVFLKGCPLNCLWCHNPESKSIHPELFYDARKCIGCGQCRICPQQCHQFNDGIHQFDRTACIQCGKCAEVCPPGALEMAGKEDRIEDVLTEVMKDEAFYRNSGGGLTLSGGEPMLQFKFTLALLQAAKEKGLHTCIETCGFAPEDHYRQIAPYVDIFLFDYKETDPIRHKEFTGVDNTLIRRNLYMLDELGANIILRCPIIPTLNDTDAHFAGIARTANELAHVMEINIEPYHPLGSGKSELLGKSYALSTLTFPSEETVTGWINAIQQQTHIPVRKA